MNSLLLLNGSPRGVCSNSMKMLARVAEGWQKAGCQAPVVFHLAQRANFDRAVEAFAHADVVLLGMPLYVDSMPSIVKSYIEAIAPRAAASQAAGGNPTVAFLIQSGFPEALHSRPLERYLEKLARRLGSPYAGTIVRGGSKSPMVTPEEEKSKLWAQLRTLGEQLARNGRFDQEELRDVASIERFSAFTAALLSVAVKFPTLQSGWNRQLKRNGAWERRFDAPFGPAFQR
jgi:hypothetical protein